MRVLFSLNFGAFFDIISSVCLYINIIKDGIDYGTFR